MNSLVLLVSCLAAASASYAGGYHGAYGWPGTHGGYYAPYAYAGHGYAGHGYAGHGYAGLGYAGHGYGGHGYAGHGYSGHGYAGHGVYGGYHGPLANPVVLPSGYLADTPEVAAAKGAHLTAVAAATHRNAAYGHGYGYGSGSGYGHGYGYGHGHGSLAVPVVLPSGYLADTPDVAAVKASHLTAVAHQKSVAHSGYGHGYGYGYPYGHGYYHH